MTAVETKKGAICREAICIDITDIVTDGAIVCKLAIACRRMSAHLGARHG